MRKFLLLSALAAVVQISSAQSSMTKPQLLGNPRIKQLTHEERPVVLLPNGSNSAVSHHATTTNHKGTNTAKSLTNGTPLNSVQIGSAGNLLTITNGLCNQLYVNSQLGLVSFIHRTDPTVNPAANIAEYSLDFSKNLGATWHSNMGPITNSTNPNEPIDNNGSNPHGRFPQGAIFNPAGNVNADSAYQVYSGTWHNAAPSATSGSWVGQMRGRGQFTGDSSTFNVHIDTINNGVTNVATGFCPGAPGVFWAVNEDYTGTFSTSSNAITQGIIVEKGVWNAVTKDIDWTATEIVQQFDSFLSGSIIATAATSFDIAFDPTGQYGWISCLGDVSTNPTDSLNSPIFWKTTNGGNTWTGPIQLHLDSLPGVVGRLNGVTLYTTSAGNTPGAITSGKPTTSFEGKLAVDYAGNPHLFTTVGNGNGYSIESGAGYIMYDITLNPSNSCTPTWNGWAAVFVDSVETLRGTTTPGDGANALTEDNRPLVSTTADGTKLFFFWLASDPNYPAGSGEGDVNGNPNLLARGFDLVHSTSTPTINFTEGDPLWAGADVTYPVSGSYLGAYYPTVSPLAAQNSNSYTVPLVLTQIDYTANTQSSSNPAQFWYVSNLTFSQFDFTVGVSASLTPIGADTVYVVVGSSYQDSGAVINYLDTACTHSGLLHVVTDVSGLNTNAPGNYSVNYAAEDGSGNIYATGKRTVIVVSAPVAKFVYSEIASLTILFVDSSKYNPTSWSWTFGDGGSDVSSQTPSHAYTAPGTYHVCLTATNAYGSSAPYCDSVVVTIINGINQVDFASRINMFPNPTSGKVSITLTGNATPDFTVGVYNILGEEVIATGEYKAGTTNVDLNAGSLSDGIYLVKIQSNQGSSVKRLTVARK